MSLYIGENSMNLHIGETKVKLNALNGDYIISDGKLVWANLNLYLRFPARLSASEGFGRPIINTGILITDTSFGLQVKYRAYKRPFEGMLLLGNIESYRYQKDSITIFGKTNDFSTLLNNSICTLKWDGPSNLATLELGDGRIETIQIVSGTKIGSSTQKLGSSWNYQTGFDYYYFKIFQNNTLIKYLVPVPAGLKIGNYTVPSNGMWDIVTQQFVGNSGTGELSYGRDE